MRRKSQSQLSGPCRSVSQAQSREIGAAVMTNAPNPARLVGKRLGLEAYAALSCRTLRRCLCTAATPVNNPP